MAYSLVYDAVVTAENKVVILSLISFPLKHHVTYFFYSDKIQHFLHMNKNLFSVTLL